MGDLNPMISDVNPQEVKKCVASKQSRVEVLLFGFRLLTFFGLSINLEMDPNQSLLLGFVLNLKLGC